MTGEDVTIIVDYGEVGKSAYDLAVQNGYVGTITQWLASLQGGTNTYVQDFATASGLTTKAVIDVEARLANPLPLMTGAATQQGLADVVTAVNNKPVTQIPTTLAKESNFVGLATNEKLNELNDSIGANKNAINALSDKIDALIGATEDNKTVSVGNLPPGSTDPATETTLDLINDKIPTKGQATAVNSSPVVIASDQTQLSVKATSTNQPLPANGYGNAFSAYVILDGGANTVSITGSGDFVTAGQGKASIVLRTTGVSINNFHIDSDGDCYAVAYNAASAAIGLTTSIKHRWHIRVGANNFPVKDEVHGTAWVINIVGGATLGNTSAATAKLIINANYVA